MLEDETLSRLVRYELWRRGDNGDESLIRSFNDFEEAEKMREAYFAKGHKQFYWIQKRLTEKRNDEETASESLVVPNIKSFEEQIIPVSPHLRTRLNQIKYFIRSKFPF